MPPLAAEMHQERAAADAGTLGLHQSEHGLDGDRGIDRAAARKQNLPPRVGRQRVGGGDHMAARQIRDRIAGGNQHRQRDDKRNPG